MLKFARRQAAIKMRDYILKSQTAYVSDEEVASLVDED